MTLLLTWMPTGGEMIVLVVPFAVLFFIFKAGQWYGQSKERKKNN